MSARFCASAMSDMFLPWYFIVDASLALLKGKNNPARTTAVGAATAHSLSSPRSPVLFVLRLDGVAGLGPVGVGPVAQLIEIAAHGQRLAAVHRDGLAVDPVAAAGDQEHGQILQFLHAADAAHRILLSCARAGLVAGF